MLGDAPNAQIWRKDKFIGDIYFFLGQWKRLRLFTSIVVSNLAPALMSHHSSRFNFLLTSSGWIHSMCAICSESHSHRDTFWTHTPRPSHTYIRLGNVASLLLSRVTCERPCWKFLLELSKWKLFSEKSIAVVYGRGEAWLKTNMWKKFHPIRAAACQN